MSSIYLPFVTNGPPPIRFGIGVAHQRPDTWKDSTLTLLHPPVWKDWLWDHYGEVGYIPHVFTMQNSIKNTAAIALAQKDPTRLWELGNEPEQGLSNVKPKVAAAFSQLWAQQVGKHFAAPGCIVWEKGFIWLEEYLAAGGVIGDLWNIHLYFATDADDWERRWETWKAWMQRHNLTRPVLISETSGTETCDQPALMQRIAKLLRADPLLHTVLWYSDHDLFSVWPWTNLRTQEGLLTPLGVAYRTLLAQK